MFLNQARAGRSRRVPGFLKLILCGSSVCMFVCVCVCVCVCPGLRLLITSGVICYDMNLIRLVNKFYSCYMVTVVVIINWHGLSIDTRHR